MASGIAHRQWVLHRDDYLNDMGGHDDGAFRAAVEQENALNVHIQERLGVAIVSAPIRRKGDGGTWHTEAYVFKTATVPAAREDDTEIESLERALDADKVAVPDLESE